MSNNGASQDSAERYSALPVNPFRHNPTTGNRKGLVPGGRWIALLALVAHLFQAAHFATPHEYDAEGRLVCVSGHVHASDDATDHPDHCHSEHDFGGSNDATDRDGEDPDDAPSPTDPSDHGHECPFQLPGLSDGHVAAGPETESLAPISWIANGTELEAHRLARLQLAPKHGPPAGV
ncbi:MAG: hypothetical protein AAF196_04020 [Planctomycetota bacterium]